MTPDALALLGWGAAFVALILLLGVGMGIAAVLRGHVPQRSHVADVLQATAVLEQRYREERAKREQAEWEVGELKSDNNRLNRRLEACADAERKAEEYDALELESAALRTVFDREISRVADAALVTTLQLEAVKRHVPGVRDFLASLGDAGARSAPPPQNLGDAPEPLDPGRRSA